jgi:hypothetical protein
MSRGSDGAFFGPTHSRHGEVLDSLAIGIAGFRIVRILPENIILIAGDSTNTWRRPQNAE